jgi:hypothetical protein
MSMTRQEHHGRDARAINELLEELAELRELDRRRQAHAPGSAAHDAATLEADLRGRRLMDRFRDLKKKPRDARVETLALEETKPFEARWSPERGGARLN